MGPIVAARRALRTPLGSNSEESLYMARGKVKWFSEKKGYGFITPDDGGEDLFVHHSEIQASGFRTLSENDAVEFEVGQGQKGPCATKVARVD